MNKTDSALPEAENEQIAQRRQKLANWREQEEAYPNDFRRTANAGDLHRQYGESANEILENEAIQVSLAGRLMSRRIMGKASFAHLQDESGQLQLFVQRDHLPEGIYNEQFKKYDIGDIVGVEGKLFKTKTGELSLRVNTIRLLVKSMRPLPEKYHGLTDVETRYRHRYVDLMVNPDSRDVFRKRSATIAAFRRFLGDQGYIEVETPILHPIPGGANARPFITHHNALDMNLYLRVAQELYIKRLLVGGFEKVYEMNRNFRNEGVSTQHNPEFTMLEYNEAYLDYVEYMDFTEAMIRYVVNEVTGATTVMYQGRELDFAKPFQRMSIQQAVLAHHPDLTEVDCQDSVALQEKLAMLNIDASQDESPGRLLTDIFEETVEDKLIEPTFITGYPVEVSPLSRRSADNPAVTDRFELFIMGREYANGFSELNDPEDQAMRFRKQAEAKDSGDDEAMHYDADYIMALEYGLPPNAGGGIGIDRLVMLLTDSPSIRDVLLFPHMRPESGQT